MDGSGNNPTDHFLERNSSSCMNVECKTEFEDDNEQDNVSQTSTPSCISKMDYTLPKYRNNVSPAVDKLMQMMNMPSLIRSQDFSDLPTSMNRIPLPSYGNNGSFTIPIKAKKHLDICFSSPKPFVSTYKKDRAKEDRAQSKTGEINSSSSQIRQGPMSEWQETTDLLLEPDSPCKSEVKKKLSHRKQSKKKAHR